MHPPSKALLSGQHLRTTETKPMNPKNNYNLNNGFRLWFVRLSVIFYFLVKPKVIQVVFTAQCTLVTAYARSWDRMSSVRPSVTLVICDHIGWKSWKLIARTISPTPSLIIAKRRSTYSQGNMGKFGETRGGVGEKWHTGEQKR